MDYDYSVIDAHIHRANRLRSEALGNLIWAGGRYLKGLVAAAAKRIGEALHGHRLVHH